MKRISFILIIMAMNILVVLSQNKNIYLLKGQNFISKVDIEYEHHPSAELYSINGDTLLLIDKLIENNKAYIKNIRSYYNRNLITIVSKLLESDTTILTTLHFKDNYKVNNFYYSNSNGHIFDNWLINVDSQDIIVAKQISNTDRNLLGIDIENWTINYLKDSMLNYFISDGIQGIGVDDILGGRNDKEELKLKSFLINGEIQFIVKSIIEKDKKYPFTMPLKTELLKIEESFLKPSSKNGYIPININNKDVMVIKRGGYFDDEEGVGMRTYAINDKRLNRWYIKKFKGSYRSLHAFGEWLAGSIIDSGNLGNTQKRNNGIEVPGKKYRIHERTEHGSSADVRFEKLKMYPHGILYLFNVSTQTYIEWNAIENGEFQGDSEILLVHNDKVYYRINNKIYEREIINGQELGSSVLLVEDEKVPFIHWAFISHE